MEMKDELMVLASINGDDTSLANVTEAYVADRVGLVSFLAVSEENLGNAESFIQETEHNENALDELTGNVDETEAWLRSCE